MNRGDDLVLEGLHLFHPDSSDPVLHFLKICVPINTLQKILYRRLGSHGCLNHSFHLKFIQNFL